MSTAVATLRSDLERVSAELAELQDKARLAADALVRDPTRVNQQARDQANKEAELVNLHITKLKRDIVAAERQSWEDEILEFQARQAELKQQAQEIAARLTASLADTSNTAAEFGAVRQSFRDLEVRIVGRRAALKGERAQQLGYSTIPLPGGLGLREQCEELVKLIDKLKEGFST
jgi:hypothetical protein